MSEMQISPARLTRAQCAAVTMVAIVATCLFGYGAAGSYASVSHLAAVHHVPLPRTVPLGIDSGLAGTVLLDIALTWTGMPVWWLRLLRGCSPPEQSPRTPPQAGPTRSRWGCTPRPR
jgi:hypothetical protein